MGFPGMWMTQSGGLGYRVVPKCACSTIGQILYFLDNGAFYDGDVHDADQGLHKWAMEESRPVIEEAVFSGQTPIFTAVRNPYDRVLSSFFDKICGVQRNGNRYRGNLVPGLTRDYGVQVDGTFDQIASFRRFLLFARDTVRFRKPMDPDIHWSPVAGHVSTLIANGGSYQLIFNTEDFDQGMARALALAPAAHPVELSQVPRFNESQGHGPKRAHPVEAYFDDLAQHLMWETYRQDFELFGYDPWTPADRAPKREIDLDEVHYVLGQ
ncbi:MAG: sulfotransferase family protein [Mangrovicoccus sp.]